MFLSKKSKKLKGAVNKMFTFILARKLTDVITAHSAYDIDARRKCYVLAGMGFAMFMGLCLFVYTGVYYEAVNDSIMKDGWTIFIIIYIIALYILLRYLKKGIQLVIEPIIFAAMLFAALMFIYFGIFYLANGILDNSNPRTVSSVIIQSKMRNRTCSVYFNHWDHPEKKIFKRIRNSDMSKISINRTKITAQTKKGYFGYEYYVYDTFRVL